MTARQASVETNTRVRPCGDLASIVGLIVATETTIAEHPKETLLARRRKPLRSAPGTIQK